MQPKTVVMRSIVLSFLCILVSLGILLVSNPPGLQAIKSANDSPDRSWVDTTLAGLSLREKIGQLIQIRVRGEFQNREDPRFRELIRAIDQNNVGGVILFAGNVYESAMLLNELQARSRLPLLVSADFERGASFRIADTTSFPWTMAIGATGSEEYAYQQGRITAEESRALGVHWIFAPVMDVNNNPKNPVINIRSYGEDPLMVARLGVAFIRGAKSGGVLTAAKHFPGHGDTTTDSHIGLAVILADMEKLNSVELVPFRSAIEAGVDSIMTAHVAVPKVTGDRTTPATLSAEILTGLMRDTLQFNGLVVTDAMEMGGITDTYWCGLAAVRAIAAGADIVLLPTDANVAINEIERAVLRGDIPPERIDVSVRKVLEAKSRLGLELQRLVSIDTIRDAIDSPKNGALAQEIADRSITAVRDKDHLLPVNPAEDPKIFSLVLDSGLDTSPGSVFQEEMRRIFPSLRTEWANARISQEQIVRIQRHADGADMIVCSTFARLSSGVNISSIPKEQEKIIHGLMDTGKPFLWIAFGNPYILEDFPGIGTYLCTFSYSDGSQRAAAKALSGAIPVTGKMPVSIPKFVSVGDGLQFPKLEMRLRPSPEDVANTSIDALDTIRNNLIKYNNSCMHPDDSRFESCDYAQLVVGHKNSIVFNIRTGDDESSGVPLWPDSIGFNAIMSAMLAVESGRLLLEAPIADYLPEYRDTDLASRPICSLLEEMHENNPVALADKVQNAELIGEIVSRAWGLPNGRILDRQLFEPLGCAPLAETRPEDPSRYSGYATPDFAPVAQLLLNKGMYDHRRIFKPGTIQRFTASAGGRKALGWMKPDRANWTGRLFSSKAFGYMDTFGHLLWIDPEKDLFIILAARGLIVSESYPAEEAYESIIRSVMEAIESD